MNDYPGSEDERMRQLLNDAVSDVEPRDSLDSIRSRTVVTPFRARRPWILGAGAAVVATAATVAAVAVMGGNPGTTSAPDPGFAGPSGAPSSAEGSGMPNPDKSTSPSTEDDPPPSGMSSDESSPASPERVTVPVYYVGDTNHGLRLFREFHSVQSNGQDPITPALNEAVATNPDDRDYRTDWPAGTTVDHINLDGVDDDGVMTVHVENSKTDLHDRPAGMTEQEASQAIEQLIYTSQGAAQTRAPVQFMLNGERTDTLLGVPTSEPLSEGDPTAVLALVWIIDPAEGAEVQSPFKVSGLANAFEANVQWELMQGDKVVESGFTMAKEAFTMAPYSFKVDAPPGDYTLAVHDEDASGGAEGAGVWKDTKNITVVE